MYKIEIAIRKKLDPEWSDWFDGMEITHLEQGNTLLSGCLIDQTALYGVLSRLSSLGITPIYITCKELDEASPSNESEQNQGEMK